MIRMRAFVGLENSEFAGAGASTHCGRFDVSLWCQSRGKLFRPADFITC